MRTRTLGKLLAWALLSAVLISVTVWYGTLDTLPNTFRIATARDAGVYQNFAGPLADLIQQRPGHHVSREATAGSLENRERLLSNDADLALPARFGAGMRRARPAVTRRDARKHRSTPREDVPGVTA